MLVGESLVFCSRLADRSVCTRARQHCYGIGNLVRILLVRRFLVRVRLKTRASAIMCTLRARCRRTMETLFHDFMMNRYSLMSYDGRR